MHVAAHLALGDQDREHRADQQSPHETCESTAVGRHGGWQRATKGRAQEDGDGSDGYGGAHRHQQTIAHRQPHGVARALLEPGPEILPHEGAGRQRKPGDGDEAQAFDLVSHAQCRERGSAELRREPREPHVDHGEQHARHRNRGADPHNGGHRAPVRGAETDQSAPHGNHEPDDEPAAPHHH